MSTKTSTAPTHPLLSYWDTMMGSHSYYCAQNQEDARAQNAPADAVFRRRDGDWCRIGEVTNRDTLRMLQGYARQRGNTEAQTMIEDQMRAVGVDTSR